MVKALLALGITRTAARTAPPYHHPCRLPGMVGNGGEGAAAAGEHKPPGVSAAPCPPNLPPPRACTDDTGWPGKGGTG